MKVSIGTAEVQGNVIPSDGEVYDRLLSKTIHLARALRLVEPEVDAHDVLVDFVMSGYHRTWDRTKGRQFDSFCYWMLRNRLLSKLRSQTRRIAREGYPTSPDGFEEVEDAFFYVQPEYEAAENHSDLRALVEAVQQHKGSASPVELLRAMVESEEQTGDIEMIKLAEELGIMPTTLRRHRMALRSMLVEMDEASFLTEMISA